MKIFFIIVFVFFFWINILYAKILNIENKIGLEVPSNHTYIIYDNEDVEEAFDELKYSIEDLEIDFYLVGPKMWIDLEKAVIDGEDIMENKYVKSILRKAEKKNFRDEEQQMKWFISEAKKIIKKEKVDFISYALIFNKNLSQLLADDGDEILGEFNELQNMNNSQLKNKSKEIRRELTSLAGNNKSIPINDDMTINLNKFDIAKNEYEKLFLKTNGKLIMIMGAIKLDLFLNAFLGEHNNKTFMFVSACWVNCSKFNNKFDKMIKSAFSTNLSSKTINTSSSYSVESTLTEEIKKLNELYKSGVLTKDEFEKAKKKLLN